VSSSPTLHPGDRADADRPLLEACLEGRPGAWEAFVARFSVLFAHVAARTAGRRQIRLSAADAEDLLAEILLECLRNDSAVLRSFAGRSSLATYLTVIARRVAVRRLVRDLETFRAVPATVPLPEPAAAATDLPSRLEDREQVAGLLDRLEPDEAQLVRLHHLESRSYGEISRLTGLPLGSIGPALSRARTKLRGLMEATGPDAAVADGSG
jgi:RNA polymerase sigma-70 factor (ECF subfamily)